MSSLQKKLMWNCRCYGIILKSFQILRQSIAQKVPNYIEIMALSGMLHEFYNGIENIFKRIAIHCDGGSPGGAAWHQNLLMSMTVNTENRLDYFFIKLRTGFSEVWTG